MEQSFRITVRLVLAALLWGVLAHMIFVVDAGSAATFSAQRFLTLFLLVAAPAATFVPLARWMRAPFYDKEGIAGWSTFGFALTFLRPSDPPSLAQFLLILLPLIVAVGTAATCCAYLLGLHFYRDNARRYDIVRARREGYLGAFCVVAMLLLYGIGTLTVTSAVLLVALVVLVEVLVLTRGVGKPEARRLRA